MSVSEITKLDNVRAKSLRDTGFSDEATELRNRLIVAIDGESGGGKNRLAFSFPDPIAFMSFDPNYGKALKEARERGKIIHRAGYSLPVIAPDGRDGSKVASKMGEVWDQFAVDFMGAVRDKGIETIIFDTGTELFELITYALYGKNVQVMPKDRGHAYAVYRQLIREVENTNKNLVILHKMKDEWLADKSTGRRIRAGYKDTEFSVTTTLLMEKDMKEPYPDRYKLYITKCHLQPEVEWDGGEPTLQGDAIEYEMLEALIFQ